MRHGTVLGCSRALLLLERKTASERVASFPLMLSERNGHVDRISLPMGRGDIADHLGLTIETVSRVFTRFRAQGIIQLNSASEVVIRTMKRSKMPQKRHQMRNCPDTKNALGQEYQPRAGPVGSVGAEVGYPLYT